MKTNKQRYLEGKEKARQEAIEFFDEQLTLSWEGLSIATEYFSKLAKRYGLIEEFRENGII